MGSPGASFLGSAPRRGDHQTCHFQRQGWGHDLHHPGLALSTRVTEVARGMLSLPCMLAWVQRRSRDSPPGGEGAQPELHAPQSSGSQKKTAAPSPRA